MTYSPSPPPCAMNKEKIQQLKLREELIHEQEHLFKEGEMLTFVQVRFPGNARSFPFLLGNESFQYGQQVMALSDRGMALGYINSFPYKKPFTASMLPLMTILKIAGEHELQKDSEYKESEFRAKKICEAIITDLNLPMELTHVEYTQFGKKAVFYFTAPERVDFRELVKRLVMELKMRIELRQIHLRDRTAGLGGIGVCGRQLCCSSFLGKYGHVCIKMAKNQNLTLSPTKLNGPCGQLKCCLQFEDEIYQEMRHQLPPLGSFIEATNGDRGKVERHYLLQGHFEMLTTEGCRRRYTAKLYDPERSFLPKELLLDGFDFIRDETQIIID